MQVSTGHERGFEPGLTHELTRLVEGVLPGVSRVWDTTDPVGEWRRDVPAERESDAVADICRIRRREVETSTRAEHPPHFMQGLGRIVPQVLEDLGHHNRVERAVIERVRRFLEVPPHEL